jgi:NAD(P)-dependent dehydrogenase (short-subunit alcohol dehydrogenase family)
MFYIYTQNKIRSFIHFFFIINLFVAVMNTNTNASSTVAVSDDGKFSMADQVQRFAHQKATSNTRALDIEKHFKGNELQGKYIVITGTNRGLGLGLVKEAIANGAKVIATCRKASSELKETNPLKIIEGVDVTIDSDMKNLIEGLKGVTVDILINNAGYFMKERESILDGTMNFSEEIKMIDICAVGMLRVTNALYGAGNLKTGSRIAMITSQGGSISWRNTQCPNGGDYGHHMSKAAANMAGKLVANELRHKGIITAILHPGFIRTDMTRKYAEIWDIEGAVTSDIASKRVLHEVNIMSKESNGKFINCEDGLEIPW